MKHALIILAATFALASCASDASREGARWNYRCAADKEFSYRRVTGAIEVYAAGVTNRLEPAAGAEGQFRSADGAVTLTQEGSRATLAGVYGGPYENCQRHNGGFFPRLW
jgi:hypothetical protein